MTDLTEIFGDPISVYTSDEAVDDGMLVEAAPDQYGPKILFTRAVFDAVWPPELVDNDDDRHPDGRTYLQRAIPLIQDALLICRGRPNDHLWTAGLEGNVTGRDVWIGLNERGGITLMFPEDY